MSEQNVILKLRIKHIVKFNWQCINLLYNVSLQT